MARSARSTTASIWARALTLRERRGALAAPRTRRLAEQRLARWRAQAPFEDAALFRRRLELDQFSEAELLAVLGEPTATLARRLPHATEWASELHAALAPSGPTGGSRNLWSASGVSEPEFFAESGLDVARRRVRLMSETSGTVPWLTTPEPLGDDLVMRRATVDDVEALCDFNGEIFREPSRSEPNEWVQTWTRDLMSRQHPTFKPDDFLVVEDTRARRIISSLCLISQTWSYGGVEFGLGLPELVGTDPAYRRRGLIRRQFDVIHRWSAERGQLVQAISGIPWFYRQFGYEMTLEHNTGRVLARFEVPKLAEGKTEPYHVRPATPQDVPFIAEVDRQSRDRYLVTAVRDEALWRLELDGRHERFGADLAIVESPAGDPIGFVAHAPLRRGNRLVVYAIELRHATSWLETTPTVLRYLAQRGAALPTRRGDDEPFEVLAFALGTQHPIYRVVGNSLRPFREYAYYIRVPDLPAFIRRIAPVLEQRLADSVATGYSGDLQLSFYRSGLAMHFDNGRLMEVNAFNPPQDLDSGASFPDLTFLQLLFGWRSRAEIEAGYPDCSTSGDEAGVLLDALFPKQPSQAWPIQ